MPPVSIENPIHGSQWNAACELLSLHQQWSSLRQDGHLGPGQGACPLGVLGVFPSGPSTCHVWTCYQFFSSHLLCPSLPFFHTAQVLLFSFLLLLPSVLYPLPLFSSPSPCLFRSQVKFLHYLITKNYQLWGRWDSGLPAPPDPVAYSAKASLTEQLTQ